MNDFKKCINHKINLINCVSQPIAANEIYKNLLTEENYFKIINNDIKCSNLEEKHNIFSKHSIYWDKDLPYLYKKEDILRDLEILKNKIQIKFN